MSYILDALRRADAERERGHVPGIHAQPTRHAAASGVTRTTHRLGLSGIVAVLLLAIGGLSWRLLGQETGAPAVAVVAAPSLSTSPSTPVNSVSAPAVTGASPAVEPSVAATPPPRVGAAAPALPAAKQAVAGVIVPPRKTPAAAPVPRSVPEAHASAAAAAPSATIYTAEELPEDVRRDLPKLAIGGSIYSESAASRFVIVNGQLLHEGDTVVPGLVLQQIKLKSAVLAYRGYRYRIAL